MVIEMPRKKAPPMLSLAVSSDELVKIRARVAGLINPVDAAMWDLRTAMLDMTFDVLQHIKPPDHMTMDEFEVIDRLCTALLSAHKDLHAA